MNLMIVPGILVCSSFLMTMCMFIVSKALRISSATVIVRAGGAFCSSLLVYVCGLSFIVGPSISVFNRLY